MSAILKNSVISESDAIGEGACCPIPRFADRRFPDDFDELQTCDAIRYVRAMRQAAREYPDAFGFNDDFDGEISAAAVDRVIKKPDYNTLICEEDGQIVGGISYARPCTGTLELGYLFRHQSARSPAIGRLLLRDGLRMTQAKGDTHVVLSVLRRNLSAIALYESVGFRPEDCGEEGELLAGELNAAITMELSGTDNIMAAIRWLTDQITKAHRDTQAERGNI